MKNQFILLESDCPNCQSNAIGMANDTMECFNCSHECTSTPYTTQVVLIENITTPKSIENHIHTTGLTDMNQVPSNIFIITHKYGAEQAVIYTHKSRAELSDILLMFNGIVCDQIDESQELYPGSLVSILKHYELCNEFKDFSPVHIEHTESNVIDMYWVWEKESHRLDQIVKDNHDAFPGLIDVIKNTYHIQNTNDIKDHLLSLARHYMNEHVVPSISDNSNDTHFVYVGEDNTHGYYASLLTNDKISDDQALELFHSRNIKGESLIKITINFDEMEYITTIINTK